jgi:RNA-directed DNA polymerase
MPSTRSFVAGATTTLGCAVSEHSPGGHLLYQKLRAWARRRHPNKVEGWTTHRYWIIQKGKGWWFRCQQGNQTFRMVRHADTPLLFGISNRAAGAVRDRRSPFDGDWAYWGSRLGRYTELGLSKATILKRQRGRCMHCKLLFWYEDKIETDHITPLHKGGHNGYDNLQLLHRHCHHIKTVSDQWKAVESVTA